MRLREWTVEDRFGSLWCIALDGLADPANGRAVDVVGALAHVSLGGAPDRADRVAATLFAVAAEVGRSADAYEAWLRLPLDDARRQADEVTALLLRAATVGLLHVEPVRRTLRFHHDPEEVTPPSVPAGPEEPETWFELRVLDEVGAPVDGLELVYAVEGVARPVTTNGSGVARLAGVTASFASVAVKSLDGARQKLAPRWSTPRTATSSADPTAIVRELDGGLTASIALTSETPKTLILTPHFRCHEVPGAHFEFGRSFVLAEALATLASIATELSEEGRLGMIFAHTDLAGPEALNKELSERRAKAVKALFTHDADTWEALYSGTDDGPSWQEKWDLDEAQRMLNALGVTDASTRPTPRPTCSSTSRRTTRSRTSSSRTISAT